MTRRESPPPAPVPSRSSATSRSFGRVARAGLVGGATIVALGAASACLDRPVAPAEPRTSNTFSEKVSLTKIDKIDLLFMIDNSASMADKQSILATAVPDLVSRLVRPNCVSAELDANGQPKSTTPQPAGGCGPGFALEFNAIRDIHIGIVTSSLGGHGADVCIPGAVNTGVGQDDRAHLLTRGIDAAQTWRGTGFFQWDPDKDKDPPGSGFDGGGSAAPLVTPFTAVVKGAGQTGCGYEASLEAWYRFLVEPAPPDQVGKAPEGPGSTLIPSGVDDDLLQQRAEFLRPDSLLAIVLLSDENDCSTAEGVLPLQVTRFSGSTPEVPEGWEDLALNNSFDDKNQAPSGFLINYIAGQGALGTGAFRMKSGTAACATDPTSAECHDCFTAKGGADPSCRTLTPEEDNRTLRCWDQKRRFGIDMLYPVQRYVDGLREATIFPLHDRVVKTRVMKDQPPPDRYAATDLVPNPIFQDLPYLRFQELKARLTEGSIDQATFDAKAASLGDSKLTKGNRAAFPARRRHGVLRGDRGRALAGHRGGSDGPQEGLQNR